MLTKSESRGKKYVTLLATNNSFVSWETIKETTPKKTKIEHYYLLNESSPGDVRHTCLLQGIQDDICTPPSVTVKARWQ